MERVTESRTRNVSNPSDPIARKGFKSDKPVSVPLDFLQGISSIAQRNLERRPPKLKLKKKAISANALDETNPAAILNPVASKDSADIAFQVAELVMRRQKDIKDSEDEGAKAGLATLDRMVRMFEHIYVLNSGSGYAGVEK